MRAEDLFEAMGELDEQFIAQSEADSRRAKEASRVNKKEEKEKKKRTKWAEFYRYAAVAMTTAAAVFVVLAARDMAGARSSGTRQNTDGIYAESAAETTEEETAPGVLASGAPESETEREIAQNDAEEETAVTTDESTQSVDSTKDTGSYDAAEEAAAEKDAKDAEAAAETETASAEDAAEEQAALKAEEEAALEAEEEEILEAEKNAVDMLGDFKGDYVKLEFISAQDLANGGSRTEPKYTEEGEQALSDALENGEKKAAMFTDEGSPVYYVYLTDDKGDEDMIVFYSKGYVGADFIPGVVLKLTDESYERVMKLFQ